MSKPRFTTLRHRRQKAPRNYETPIKGKKVVSVSPSPPLSHNKMKLPRACQPHWRLLAPPRHAARTHRLSRGMCVRLGITRHRTVLTRRLRGCVAMAVIMRLEAPGEAGMPASRAREGADVVFTYHAIRLAFVLSNSHEYVNETHHHNKTSHSPTPQPAPPAPPSAAAHPPRSRPPHAHRKSPPDPAALTPGNSRVRGYNSRSRVLLKMSCSPAARSRVESARRRS